MNWTQSRYPETGFEIPKTRFSWGGMEQNKTPFSGEEFLGGSQNVVADRSKWAKYW